MRIRLLLFTFRVYYSPYYERVSYMEMKKIEKWTTVQLATIVSTLMNSCGLSKEESIDLMLKIINNRNPKEDEA